VTILAATRRRIARGLASAGWSGYYLEGIRTTIVVLRCSPGSAGREARPAPVDRLDHLFYADSGPTVLETWRTVGVRARSQLGASRQENVTRHRFDFAIEAAARSGMITCCITITSHGLDGG